MGRALLISDLHLSAERPGVSELFFRFLNTQASGAERLYILGDLFDYWIGDDELSLSQGHGLAQIVVEQLSRLHLGGTNIYLMHGNRDFLLGQRFADASGARLLADPSIARLAGENTLLMHGDLLCTDDIAYQEFRREVRAPAWQLKFQSHTLAERHEAMARLRADSETQKKSSPPEIMDVNSEAVGKAFRFYDVKRLIHGHTHRPAHHRHNFDGKPCERWVLPDWGQSGGYLVADDSSLSLKRI